MSWLKWPIMFESCRLSKVIGDYKVECKVLFLGAFPSQTILKKFGQLFSAHFK